MWTDTKIYRKSLFASTLRKKYIVSLSWNLMVFCFFFKPVFLYYVLHYKLMEVYSIAVLFKIKCFLSLIVVVNLLGNSVNRRAGKKQHNLSDFLRHIKSLHNWYFFLFGNLEKHCSFFTQVVKYSKSRKDNLITCSKVWNIFLNWGSYMCCQVLISSIMMS